MAYQARHDVVPHYDVASQGYTDQQHYRIQQASVQQRQYSQEDAGVSYSTRLPQQRQYSNPSMNQSHPPHHDDLVSALSYQGPYHETNSTLHEDYPREDPQWDSRSAKSHGSHYNGSQVHLNPQYEMTQVPPMPSQSLPYAHQANYPPRSDNGYGTTREKMMRRRSVKKVELQQGNLVLDVQVPSHIIPQGRVEEEMTKMRYTGEPCSQYARHSTHRSSLAATCDPDDFFRNRVG